VGVGGGESTTPLSSDKAITAFSFTDAANSALSEDAVGIIDGTNITVAVPNGTDVSALIATFTTTGVSVTVSGTAQTSGVTANDFSSAVTYRVRAEDSTTQDYIVTVIPTSKVTLNPVWDFYINSTWNTDTDPDVIGGYGTDGSGTGGTGTTGSNTGYSSGLGYNYQNFHKLVFTFDIRSLTGGTIHSAYFRVYLFSPPANSENVMLENIYYGDTDGFPSPRSAGEEYGGYIITPAIAGSQPATTEGWVQFDVTAKLQADIDFPRGNSQLRLGHTNRENYGDYYCTWGMLEHATYKPELVVTYY